MIRSYASRRLHCWSLTISRKRYSIDSSFIVAICTITEPGSGTHAVQAWSITHDNVLNVDFISASALFVYLVPEGIKAIRDSLIQVPYLIQC
jgi:hypothetical protein